MCEIMGLYTLQVDVESTNFKVVQHLECCYQFDIPLSWAATSRETPTPSRIDRTAPSPGTEQVKLTA